MNRKLLTIAIVPLIVGLSGAFAFSIYQGTMVNTVRLDPGVATVDMQAYCDFSNIGPNHGITLSWNTWGGKAYDGTSLSGSVLVQPGTSTTCWSLRVSPDVIFLSPHTSWVKYKLNVVGMEPGDWIGLAFIYTNCGAGIASVCGTEQLPVTLSFSGPWTFNMAATPGSSFPDCANGACTSSPLSTGSPGFYYYWGLPSSSTTLCPAKGGMGTCTGSTGAEYYLYLGLDICSGRWYSHSVASLTFEATATAP